MKKKTLMERIVAMKLAHYLEDRKTGTSTWEDAAGTFANNR